jgi:hypothetical protein
MSFLQSPRLARRPRSSAARSAAWRLLARRRPRHRRPEPAFAKTESATAAGRSVAVAAAAPRQGIKTSPKCQRESTAQTARLVLESRVPRVCAAVPQSSSLSFCPCRQPPRYRARGRCERSLHGTQSRCHGACFGVDRTAYSRRRRRAISRTAAERATIRPYPLCCATHDIGGRRGPQHNRARPGN